MSPRATSGGTSDADIIPLVFGNKNSKIYHVEGCPGQAATSARNRVLFKTENDALSAG